MLHGIPVKAAASIKMSQLKLHTYPKNKNAWKALIAAEYVDVKIEVVECQLGKDNKSPEFLDMNPNGKVGIADLLLWQGAPPGPAHFSSLCSRWLTLALG
jgi:hypothetical protein